MRSKTILLCIVMYFISFNIYAQYNVGDQFQLGYFKYRVDKIEFTKKVSNGLTSITADGIFLITYLTVINTDRESSTLLNSMFKVYDSEDYEYGTSQSAMIVLILKDQDKVFMAKEFQPRIPQKIIVPFEVPTDQDIYTLQVSGGLGTNKKSYINLGE